MVNPITVLAVDDNADMLLMLKRGLELIPVQVAESASPVQMRVHTAETVAEAQKLLRTHEIDCALVDLDLGHGGNSSELCETLIVENVPFIRVTGNTEKEIEERLRGKGVVYKPVTLVSLGRQIVDAVETIQ